MSASRTSMTSGSADLGKFLGSNTGFSFSFLCRVWPRAAWAGAA
jgi:hypothetical protein